MYRSGFRHQISVICQRYQCSIISGHPPASLTGPSSIIVQRQTGLPPLRTRTCHRLFAGLSPVSVLGEGKVHSNRGEKKGQGTARDDKIFKSMNVFPFNNLSFSRCFSFGWQNSIDKAIFSQKNGTKNGAFRRSFCTPSLKPSMAEEIPLDKEDDYIGEKEKGTEELMESDPWLLRNLLVTTNVNRSPEKPEGVRINVAYMDTGAELDPSDRKATPTVLAIHGTPGSHENMLPLVRDLHEKEDYRVVIINMPGYKFSKGLTEEDDFFFTNTPQECLEFVENFMEMLELERIDLFVGHSAGAILWLMMMEKTDIVRSAMLVCAFPGHVASRMCRPLWGVKMISSTWETRSGQAFLRWFLPKLNNAINWVDIDEPQGMAFPARFFGTMDFKMMTNIAAEISKKEIPLVYFLSKNDRAAEVKHSLEWAKILGVEKNMFDIYDESFDKIEEYKISDSLYKKGVMFVKAGHYPQRKPDALPILTKEASKLIKCALEKKQG